MIAPHHYAITGIFDVRVMLHGRLHAPPAQDRGPAAQDRCGAVIPGWKKGVLEGLLRGVFKVDASIGAALPGALDLVVGETCVHTWDGGRLHHLDLEDDGASFDEEAPLADYLLYFLYVAPPLAHIVDVHGTCLQLPLGGALTLYFSPKGEF